MTEPAVETVRATPRERPGHPAARAHRVREWWLGAALVLPTVALAVTFKLVPLGRGVVTSLESSNGFDGSSFAGADNYTRMLDDSMVLASFRNALLVVATLPLWIVLPLVLALLIHQRTPAGSCSGRSTSSRTPSRRSWSASCFGRSSPRTDRSTRCCAEWASNRWRSNGSTDATARSTHWSP
ncbi:hypothetical protein GCM10027280_53960 [Micromonospora polyrhachis]|uniref:Multiple sugar transport system permease protein n=1 Tax=Micromonospora polyrhachis TaxID=1282883 RepID=A0A7W7WLY9_9ACTN|nr:sugar ABC transporter permease [Micromonospora polyrhachis]MBB4956270.1 hypothetical protein [Micromonospora polyrhachis]